MTQEEGKILREAWMGDPCSHPEVDKEYILGTPTRYYICTQCGEELTHEQKNNI